MRRFIRPLVALVAAITVFVTVLAPTASAQDFDTIVNELERSGYYIENGAEGSTSRFQQLVDQGRSGGGDDWYFVSLNGAVSDNYAKDLFDAVRPQGNVLVYYVDNEGFANVQLATDSSIGSTIQGQSLAAFDEDWDEPEDFMNDVVDEFKRLTAGSSSGSSGSSSQTPTSSDPTSSDSGGGFPWLLIAIPVALFGGIWFMNRRSKQKSADEQLETAQKIRAELQAELDELANDVLVLSNPVDVSENDQAITYYREATDTYLDISDDLPDLSTLEQAELRELSELGTRVAHARWQMDAAEAIIAGDPIPEKPKVELPPPPKARAPRQDEERQRRRRQMPQRQQRPRVPYSRSRRRSGGGLLDVLIAGAGMMGGSRGGGMFGGGSRGRGGGMFGGGSRSRSQPRNQSRNQSRNQPRPGGGVFGGGRSSRSSSGRSSSGRTTRRPRSTARRARTTSRRRMR